MVMKKSFLIKGLYQSNLFRNPAFILWIGLTLVTIEPSCTYQRAKEIKASLAILSFWVASRLFFETMADDEKYDAMLMNIASQHTNGIHEVRGWFRRNLSKIKSLFSYWIPCSAFLLAKRICTQVRTSDRSPKSWSYRPVANGRKSRWRNTRKTKPSEMKWVRSITDAEYSFIPRLIECDETNFVENAKKKKQHQQQLASLIRHASSKWPTKRQRKSLGKMLKRR